MASYPEAIRRAKLQGFKVSWMCRDHLFVGDIEEEKPDLNEEGACFSVRGAWFAEGKKGYPAYFIAHFSELTVIGW